MDTSQGRHAILNRFFGKKRRIKQGRATVPVCIPVDEDRGHLFLACRLCGAPSYTLIGRKAEYVHVKVGFCPGNKRGSIQLRVLGSMDQCRAEEDFESSGSVTEPI
ncbi:hypothetical protein D5086_009622 [Populus alba]|uniref:Uncharacterized protein n=1 Tax=Populus alba TaxID=43335 RepID=A0ACC4CJK7_POPAL